MVLCPLEAISGPIAHEGLHAKEVQRNECGKEYAHFCGRFSSFITEISHSVTRERLRVTRERDARLPEVVSGPSVYRDRADAVEGEAVEERGGGLDGGRAVGADALLVAVVEQDVGAGVMALRAPAAALDVG